MRVAFLAAAIALAACSHPPAGTLRFVNAPPVWRVADRTPIKKPAEREYNRTLYQADSFAFRITTRTLDVRDPRRAKDVNSLDEVPDSSWFTNRIGVRDLSIEELRRGANLDEHPMKHLPWTITGAKVGGTAIGFVFKDAKGDKYLLKFDLVAVPEMETGAHVMGHRFVWAAGYNVPQDYLAFIKRSDLRISPEATKKSTTGEKSPLTEQDLETALVKAYKSEDGTMRVLASRYLSGVPIGGAPREGTRADDPNDRIPHEDRRSLRGQVAFFAWLNHSDLQEDNTLDAWVPRKDLKDLGHVVHYLIDFGKAFGVMNNSNNWRTVGYTYRLDIAMAFRTLITFGLWNRPWDQIEAPPLRGLALFDGDHFDPGSWRTNSPYWAYHDADRTDGYWGAKLVMRFTREQIAAVVDEAKYTDPRTSAYLVETLVERQRRIGEYWFRQVSPLDRFAIETAGTGTQLCFDDLAVVYGIAQAGGSRYEVDTFDFGGASTAPRQVVAGAKRACVAVALSPSDHGYTIVKLAAFRHQRVGLPSLVVHLARDARGAARIIGLRRH